MTNPIVSPDQVPFKHCPHCGETKPRGDFRVNKRSKTGLSSWCRDCQKARYHANPEGPRQQSREWYAANRDYAGARNRTYRQKHASEKSERDKAYREAHPEEIAAYQREYRAAHKDETRTYRRLNADQIRHKEREYQVSHRSEIASYRKGYQVGYRHSERGKIVRAQHEHARRARKRGVEATFTADEYELIRVAQINKRGELICWACGYPIIGNQPPPHKPHAALLPPHLDHWIPLAKGGAHAAGNMHILHGVCNLAKKDKMPTEIGRLI